MWVYSSVGRAPTLQAECHRFKLDFRQGNVFF